MLFETPTFFVKGNVFSVGSGSDGMGPTPEVLSSKWRTDLSYTKKIFTNPTWQELALAREENRRPETMSFEERDLYVYDRLGRMTCGIGFYPRLVEDVQAMGVSPREIILDQRERNSLPEKRFQADWESAIMIAARHNYEIRHRQDECLAVMSALERGIIDAAPGFGKSLLICLYSAAYRHARIHIVCEGLQILRRIADDLRKFVASPGFVGGGKCIFDRVTIVSASSLHKMEFEDSSSPKFADIVLVDEVHRMAAPSLFEMVSRYKWCKIFGFTGTESMRSDGADRELEAVFGRTVFRIDYQECSSNNLTAEMEVDWIYVNGENILEETMSPVEEKKIGIWTNDNRNQRIMERVKELLPDRHQILILTTTIEHLVNLKQFMPEMPIAYDANGMDEGRYEMYVQMGLINPETEPIMTKDRLDQLRRQFAAGEIKIIAANSVWDTGVDFPGLDTVVLAHCEGSPIRNIQGACRASRVSESTGKTKGLVVMCYDAWNPKLKGKASRIRRDFDKLGWTSLNFPAAFRGSSGR